MARNNYFQFKQFKIIQNKTALKVGTDGVLLGAWASVEKASKILDVGTGTGVIALMMAQRTSAQVTGVEIENNAAAEALENCNNSIWKERITIINSSFQQFAESYSGKFGVIISNPPFFVNNQKSKSGNLAIAKHNDLLPFSDLISFSWKLLENDGKLNIILPNDASHKFTETALKKGFFLTRLTEVRPNNRKKIHRNLMEFSKNKTALKKDCLNIHLDDLSDFTAEYKILTKNFYLKF